MQRYAKVLAYASDQRSSGDLAAICDEWYNSVTNGLSTSNNMSFLYSGEEGDAGNHPCNRDEV